MLSDSGDPSLSAPLKQVRLGVPCGTHHHSDGMITYVCRSPLSDSPLRSVTCIFHRGAPQAAPAQGTSAGRGRGPTHTRYQPGGSQPPRAAAFAKTLGINSNRKQVLMLKPTTDEAVGEENLAYCWWCRKQDTLDPVTAIRRQELIQNEQNDVYEDTRSPCFQNGYRLEMAPEV